MADLLQYKQSKSWMTLWKLTNIKGLWVVLDFILLWLDVKCHSMEVCLSFCTEFLMKMLTLRNWSCNEVLLGYGGQCLPHWNSKTAETKHVWCSLREQDLNILVFSSWLWLLGMFLGLMFKSVFHLFKNIRNYRLDLLVANK